MRRSEEPGLGINVATGDACPPLGTPSKQDLCQRVSAFSSTGFLRRTAGNTTIVATARQRPERGAVAVALVSERKRQEMPGGRAGPAGRRAGGQADRRTGMGSRVAKTAVRQARTPNENNPPRRRRGGLVCTSWFDRNRTDGVGFEPTVRF